MSDQLVGVVTSVESERQGVVATAWTGSQMTVLNAADIDRSGCDLTPDNGTTLFHATGDVAEGDSEDLDVITMTSGPPSDFPSGGTDSDGQAIPVEVRYDLWPEVLDVVAQVETSDGDTISVTVPYNLRLLLLEGFRNAGEGEQVICSGRAGQWVIDDVLGLRAEVTREVLEPDVQNDIDTGVAAAVQAGQALAAANGKSTIVHSTVAPTGNGYTVGDTWYRHNGSMAGAVDGQWHWDGSTWIQDQLADALFSNIDAGKITGGSLEGLAGFFSPSAAAVPRTEIVGSTLRIIRADDEGNEVVTVQLGGDDNDQMMITDTNGAPLGGFDETGNGLSQDMSVNGALTIGGVDLNDMLSPFPRGVVARQNLGSTAAANSLKFNNKELGATEIIWDCSPGRMYKVTYTGMVNSTAAGTMYIRFRGTSTAGHDAAPPAPSLSSPQFGQQNIVMPSSGLYPVNLVAYVGPYNGTYRIGISGQTSGAAVIGNFQSHDNWPAQLVVEDVGPYNDYRDGGVNTMGGTPYSGSSQSGSTSTKTYTRSWNVAATRTWRAGSVVSGYLMQGYYSPGQRYGLWLWDGSIAADVGSSADIKSCILTVKNVDFPMSLSGSGILRIGHFDSTSLPGSPQTSGGGAVSVSMKAGQTMKIGLPGGWWGGIATGAIRGITLGEVGSGAANNPTYGHFGTSATITMTYSK